MMGQIHFCYRLVSVSLRFRIEELSFLSPFVKPHKYQASTAAVSVQTGECKVVKIQYKNLVSGHIKVQINV